MEEVNIGQKIKEVFETRGITVTEFARRINKSRENMYSIFSRKTIDTGLLLAISRVLDFDFFKLYSHSNYFLQEEVQKLKEENQILKDYTSLLREQKSQ
jgi:transcriptional regulator with XRE-family HTH domain